MASHILVIGYLILAFQEFLECKGRNSSPKRNWGVIQPRVMSAGRRFLNLSNMQLPPFMIVTSARKEKVHERHYISDRINLRVFLRLDQFYWASKKTG